MNNQSTRPYFYVIMPLDSDEQSGIKQEIIRSIANKYGQLAHFPIYKKEARSFDLQATIRDFKGALFVLADLSFERPSCYYELGIAEVIGVPIYLVATEGTDIHQTTIREATQFYKDLEHLKEIIVNILEYSGNVSNRTSLPTIEAA